MRDHKAIALFSGGLDSLLSVKHMMNLGYEVFPVFFSTAYFPTLKAEESARRNGLDLIVHEFSSAHLKMVMNPTFGYGKNFNPCIDCHAMMLNVAGNMLQDLGADFIITGEVIGQRPMSQRRDSLAVVSRHSGFAQLIVRPLSQKCLPDTMPIKEGWVLKEEMLAINGRSRKEQIRLAEEYGITFYPPPGGGCLLTDRNFTLRLKDLVEHDQSNDQNTALLKLGRHFRLDKEHKLIVGRNNEENTILWENDPDAFFLRCEDFTGPLGMVTGADPVTVISQAAAILLSYVHKAPEQANVIYGYGQDLSDRILVTKANKEILNETQIYLPDGQ